MPTFTSSQRDAILQFVTFTQAKESVAARTLKSNNWNLESAINAYFQGQPSNAQPPSLQNIKRLFDGYRDNPSAEPDKISMEGTMKYFADLKIELDEVVTMAVFDLLQAPAMGEFEREGFANGWMKVSSPSNPCDTPERQAQYISTMRYKIKLDHDYFRQVYRSAFKYAKPAGQRSVPVEDAFAYWDMFFRKEKGGMEWNTVTTKWLDLWANFYQSEVKRPVTRDLWTMVWELAAKIKGNDGESLAWWSEDGAWPTAIDDFVAYVKKNREPGTNMDVA